MVTMVSSSQPKVPDYDPEIQAWPASLPPPLVGEVEIDRNLVMRIRDGRMTLDNEDALVTECIKVWVAHTRDGERVWWIPPKEDTETWQNQDYQKGYELMFINEGARTGQPVAILLTARGQQEFSVIFTKEIPRGRWPVKPNICTLSPRSSVQEEYIDMGYAPCFVDGFANFAQWYEHMRKVHTDLIESVTAFGKTDILQELSVKALADGKQWHVQRRAMDPRLRNAAAVSVEPPAPQA